MQYAIVYTEPGGNVAVIRPAPHARRFRADLTAGDRPHPMAGRTVPRTWSLEEIEIALDAGALENDRAFAERILATTRIWLDERRAVPLIDYAADARIVPAKDIPVRPERSEQRS